MWGRCGSEHSRCAWSSCQVCLAQRSLAILRPQSSALSSLDVLQRSQKTSVLFVTAGCHIRERFGRRRAGVWKKDAQNVIRVARYHYFPDTGPGALDAHSLFMSKTDEDAATGQLAAVEAVLLQLHDRFFASSGGHVGTELQALRSAVLSGCGIVFSRVRPCALAPLRLYSLPAPLRLYSLPAPLRLYTPTQRQRHRLEPSAHLLPACSPAPAPRGWNPGPHKDLPRL